MRFGEGRRREGRAREEEGWGDFARAVSHLDARGYSLGRSGRLGERLQSLAHPPLSISVTV